MDIEKRNSIISIALTVVIIGLVYLLYDSIRSPYELIEKQRMERSLVRERMTAIRDALILYRDTKGGFPTHLDSLVVFVSTHPEAISRHETVFKKPESLDFSPETFTYSPINPTARFLYELNDTIRPPIYLLRDPDSQDRIGSLERTTLLNAANWD